MQGFAPGINPTNPRQARVWNYLNKGDEFYPIRAWPTWAQSAAMLSHRSFRDRFTYFRWLASNGASPAFLTRVVLLTDVTNGGISFDSSGYDLSAGRHVNSMLEQLKSGKLFDSNPSVLDMHCGRVHPVNTPCK